MLKRSGLAFAVASCAWLIIWLIVPVNQNAAAAKAAPNSVFSICQGANLSLRYIDTDAAMGGVRGASYAFKNNGSAACTLSGFPHLQLLNRYGHPIWVNHIIHSEEPPGIVTLAPGGEAFFSIQYNEGGAGHVGPPCPSVRRIKVRAPGTKRWFSRRDQISLCSDVTISPVAAAAE
ncbi:MAG: DUF4232 domain-containing protein [Pyrinomonadaceae bacterium]